MVSGTVSQSEYHHIHNHYLVHRIQQPITETMTPDFCFKKILTNQIVFDHEKNLNNNKQTKTCKNSSPIKLVKIRFRNFGIG